MTSTTARLTLAVSLSIILTSCSTGQRPSAMAIAPEASTSDRYRAESDRAVAGNEQNITAVPRVYIDSEMVEESAPEVYTVVRGDTLWDISDRFLKEPWRWTEIWGYNPQVYNPHLIYPGDVLALDYVNGKPMLTLTRKGKTIPNGVGQPRLGAATPATGGSGARIKLQPQIRSESLDDAIPTISGSSISQFLVHPRVVDKRTVERAPYVIGNNDERLISSIGNKVYVRGRLNRDQTSYGVFRQSKILIDPVNGANLGYEMVHVSDAKLLSVGDPSTLGITTNKMETIAGDVLLPLSTSSATHTYTPRMPELRGEARIVSLVDAIAQTGRNQVVVLNVGDNSNIQEGDVLAVETRGKSVIDKSGKLGWEEVTLPNQRTGVLMVFKTFDRVSYALVMESTRPLKVNDIVTGI
ncbi:MAG: LysM peptidoglycan-binding domain-containing protein [Granulosicoccus sp.]